MDTLLRPTFEFTRVCVHFLRVNKDDKYSRISGKYLTRKYHDPYPLPHVNLQIGDIVYEFAENGARCGEYVFDEHTWFTYKMLVLPDTALRLMDRAAVVSEGMFVKRNRVADYFKPGFPWCSDYIRSILFNSEEIKQQPPFELLIELVCSERGTLLDWEDIRRRLS